MQRVGPAGRPRASAQQQPLLRRRPHGGSRRPDRRRFRHERGRRGEGPRLFHQRAPGARQAGCSTMRVGRRPTRPSSTSRPGVRSSAGRDPGLQGLRAGPDPRPLGGRSLGRGVQPDDPAACPRQSCLLPGPSIRPPWRGATSSWTRRPAGRLDPCDAPTSRGQQHPPARRSRASDAGGSHRRGGDPPGIVRTGGDWSNWPRLGGGRRPPNDRHGNRPDGRRTVIPTVPGRPSNLTRTTVNHHLG